MNAIRTGAVEDLLRKKGCKEEIVRRKTLLQKSLPAETSFQEILILLRRSVWLARSRLLTHRRKDAVGAHGRAPSSFPLCQRGIQGVASIRSGAPTRYPVRAWKTRIPRLEPGNELRKRAGINPVVRHRGEAHALRQLHRLGAAIHCLL